MHGRVLDHRPDPAAPVIRRLVKQAHGWDALPYIWHGDDAYLAITGDLFTVPLAAIKAEARWPDEQIDLEHRARSYLDINCGQCHYPSGAADTSGLMLDYPPPAAAASGVRKPPIAAGRVAHESTGKACR